MQEDAAATRSSITRPVASDLSRKIFYCAFVLVVACSRLAVKSHEGHPSSGSDSNVTALQGKSSRTESTCMYLPGARVIALVLLYDLRAEGKVEGPASECAVHQESSAHCWANALPPISDLDLRGNQDRTRRGAGHCRPSARLTCCPAREG